MKTRNPDRLRESSSSEVERLLLRAGRERAPRGAKRRAIATATGVVAATTLSAGTAGGAAVAGKTSAGVASFLSLKWIVVVGVASVSVAAGTAAVHVVRTDRAEAGVAEVAGTRRNAPLEVAGASQWAAVPASARHETSASASVAPAVAGIAPAAPVITPVAAVIAPVAPIVTSPAPVIALAVASGPASKAGVGAAPNAAAELALLDQARGAIHDGQPAEGLAILDAYRARFPRGAMGPEASILRVEALVRAGDRDGAKREGDAFLRASPNSPYAARIDSLLSTPNP
jgi:hypothetical protein